MTSGEVSSREKDNRDFSSCAVHSCSRAPPAPCISSTQQRSFKLEQAQKTTIETINKKLNLQGETNSLGLFNLANQQLRGDEVTCSKNSRENRIEKNYFS